MESIECEIPCAPPSQFLPSYESLYEFLQLFYRDAGAALIITSSKKKKVGDNGQAILTNVKFACDRGAARPSISTGIRKAATKKRDFPFQITASTSQAKQWQWSYSIIERAHNHSPSLDSLAHNVHRRRMPGQIALEKDLSKQKALPARELDTILRDRDDKQSFFQIRDVYNDRQKLRHDLLDCKTATQAFIGHLKSSGLCHVVKYDAEHKVEALFWTYPWCEEMWKRFPEVMGLDNKYKTNRLEIYLFQATGMTDQKRFAKFAFGLINTEKEGFTWLCQQLDAF